LNILDYQQAEISSLRTTHGVNICHELTVSSVNSFGGDVDGDHMLCCIYIRAVSQQMSEQGLNVDDHVCFLVVNVEVESVESNRVPSVCDSINIAPIVIVGQVRNTRRGSTGVRVPDVNLSGERPFGVSPRMVLTRMVEPDVSATLETTRRLISRARSV